MMDDQRKEHQYTGQCCEEEHGDEAAPACTAVPEDEWITNEEQCNIVTDQHVFSFH